MQDSRHRWARLALAAGIALCTQLYHAQAVESMPDRPQGLGPQSLWRTPALTWWNAKSAQVKKHLVAHARSLKARHTPGRAGSLTPSTTWRSQGDRFLSQCMVAGERVAAAARALQAFLEESMLQYLRRALGRNSGVVSTLAITIEGSWASISGQGTRQPPHVHSMMGLSGTYYLDCGTNGSAAGNGPALCAVTLEDPRPPAATSDMPELLREKLGFGTSKTFRLMPGSVLVHPSWLVHAAAPSQGVGERIAISFTANVAARHLPAGAGTHMGAVEKEEEL